MRKQNNWIRVSLMLLACMLLLSLYGCSAKDTPYLPREYWDGMIQGAVLYLDGTDVVYSTMTVNLDQKNIRLYYEFSELEVTEADKSIPLEETNLTGDMLIGMINSNSETLEEIVGYPSVAIGITSGEQGQLSLSDFELGREILLYDTNTKAMTRAYYDGAGGKAVASIWRREEGEKHIHWGVMVIR